jgi:hypothetical protein
LLRNPTSPDGRGDRARCASSLRCRNQFANLGHGNRAIAQQMIRDGALHRIFREPERIVRRDPMIDD